MEGNEMETKMKEKEKANNDHSKVTRLPSSHSTVSAD
jgi:hypothetical protein